MSIATVSPTRKSGLRENELQDELRHIRDLIFVRDLLQERGATPAELAEYEASIDQAHGQLAESAKRASARLAAAA